MSETYMGDFFQENHGIGSEIDLYGLIWTHIKTRRSPMAQDHFQTTPDPQNSHGRAKNPKRIQEQTPKQERI